MADDTNDPLAIQIRRIRTEIAFLLGDEAIAGPSRAAQVESLRQELHRLIDRARAQSAKA